jgi:hypothetical protein
MAMFKTRKRAPDPHEVGLAEIDAWHRWFTEGHRQRLTDLQLPPEQFEKELAAALQIGSAVAERMKSDYLARRR